MPKQNVCQKHFYSHNVIIYIPPACVQCHYPHGNEHLLFLRGQDVPGGTEDSFFEI